MNRGSTRVVAVVVVRHTDGPGMRKRCVRRCQATGRAAGRMVSPGKLEKAGEESVQGTSLGIGH